MNSIKIAWNLTIMYKQMSKFFQTYLHGLRPTIPLHSHSPKDFPIEIFNSFTSNPPSSFPTFY